MEQLKVKEGKVVIDVPVKLSNELKAKITQVINEWGDYKKPKVLFENGSMIRIGMDKALITHFDKLVKEGKCIICGKSIGDGRYGIVSQGMKADKEFKCALFCTRCFSVMAETIEVLKSFKGRVRIEYYAGKKRLQDFITCPDCSCKGEVIKNGDIEWHSKDTRYSGTRKIERECILKKGDRVRLPNGKKATICSDIFVDVKKSFNVEKDEIKKGEHKIETFDIKQLSYLPAKVKFSKKKLRRVLRSLKRRGL